MQKKNQSPFLVPGIVMMGMILRIPFTSIPPVISEVAKGLGVSISSLGILTTIPLLSFAIVFPLAPKFGQKWGIEKSFAIFVLLMAVGSLLRIISMPFLFLGTVLIGVGIATLNVLLPSAVVANFPTQIGRYTSTYSLAMTIATILASSLAVPIVRATNWQTLILILSVLIVLALVVWLPNTKQNHVLEPRPADGAQSSIWRNKRAWYLLAYGGLQSLYYYTAMAWLPTMAQQARLSAEAAGYLSGIFTLITLPLTFVLPTAFTRWNNKQRRWIMVGFSAFAFVGVGMILFNGHSFLFWLIVNLLMGFSGGALFPYLLTMFSVKTTTPTRTAELSGMAQSGGYLLAAFGPTLFGYGFGLWHSWTIQLIVLLVLIVLMAAAAWMVEKTDIIA
ncbi:CynX/NimT family MFS transporter [Weissella confusa]|uniref:CynX/NimT family MFS transporter n=1 Tax=Weissella confusa TaxID=1583 RepID=UPI00223A9A1F|nr:MFS transporter [Weissella confusa]MCT0025409.1 MFS transporter [Weissella confusa]